MIPPAVSLFAQILKAKDSLTLILSRDSEAHVIILNAMDQLLSLVPLVLLLSRSRCPRDTNCAASASK